MVQHDLKVGWNKRAYSHFEGGEVVAVGVLVGVLADVGAVVLIGGEDLFGVVQQPGPVPAVGVGGLGGTG